MTSLPILEELDQRGLLNDCTDRHELTALLGGQRVSFYTGFDPTGTSLHVGSLVPIATMARLQRAGHKPIALVGGATGMIGDPSGRSEERHLLGPDQLAANAAAIEQQLARFLDFGGGPSGAVMVNNYDWFAPITFLEFLRDVGKLLSVNYMAAKDSVRSRLENREQGISFTEFSYMLLQAYDFVVLARERGCRLQVGGSDQWGNITAGIELQRKLGGERLFGMTVPLLLDASGEKFGKTASGTRLWLDADHTSAYAFYQFWLNTDDTDVARMLKLFSFRSLSEIDEIVKAHAEAPHLREGQRALAGDITAFVHGEDATRRAIAASQVMFGGSLADLRDRDLEPLLGDVPTSTIARSELEHGIGLVDLLTRTGLAASHGAARRLLTGGGVYLNNVRQADPARVVKSGDLGTESMMLLRAGKKNYHILRLG